MLELGLTCGSWTDMEAEAEKSRSPDQLWRALKKNLSMGHEKKIDSVSNDNKLWLKHHSGPKSGRGGFGSEIGLRSEP